MRYVKTPGAPLSLRIALARGAGIWQKIRKVGTHIPKLPRDIFGMNETPWLAETIALVEF